MFGFGLPNDDRGERRLELGRTQLLIPTCFNQNLCFFTPVFFAQIFLPEILRNKILQKKWCKKIKNWCKKIDPRLSLHFPIKNRYTKCVQHFKQFFAQNSLDNFLHNFPTKFLQQNFPYKISYIISVKFFIKL